MSKETEVKFEIDEELLQDLKRSAEYQNMTLSELMEYLIKKYLGRIEKNYGKTVYKD